MAGAWKQNQLTIESWTVLQLATQPRDSLRNFISEHQVGFAYVSAKDHCVACLLSLLAIIKIFYLWQQKN